MTIYIIIQLYKRRIKYVKTVEEGKRFGESDESYMTEESPNESDCDVVARHELQWQSNGNE